MWRRVWHQVLRRWGARVGIVWIAIIAFFAVFAPLLANSHPLLMRAADGTISSPMLRHLTPADVAIPIMAIAAILWLRFGPSHKAWRWGLLIAFCSLTIGLCMKYIAPPRAIVYSQYRQLAAEGHIDWAVYAPIPYSPTDRLGDQPTLLHPLAPSTEHLLGTEPNGADILSRMLHASRIAIAVGFIATGIAMVIGIVVGGIMGYFSGFIDLIGMRFVEVFAAIPVFFLLLTFVAFFPRNLYIMMVIIGLTGWVGYARFIRAEFLKLRQQDFVQAARACGLPLWSILFRHMLPNGIAPVLVAASFGVASAILYESTLSFLGLGLVDEPSWGQLLNQATSSGGGFHWWLATFPGIAIFLTVFAFNLIGEALRDAIDPYTQKAAS
jgi:peptide/nickel transport system permease protein